MKRWLVVLAGLMIWAAHFIGLYLISSAADVWSNPDAPFWRLIALGFSLTCLGTAGGLALFIRRRRRGASGTEAWEAAVGLTGVLVAGIGMVWQTAPLAF